MHAYLLIGHDQKKIDEEAHALAQKLNAEIIEFSLEKVGDTRDLSRFVSLSHPKAYTVYIRNINKATSEAVNAFLKILEEPQKNINYILTSTNEYQVIPTILSRCQVVRPRVSTEADLELASKFLKMGVGEKLKLFEKLKKREEVLEYLQNLIYSLHKLMIKKPTIQTATVLANTQKTFNALEANGNIIIHLTNLAIHSSPTTPTPGVV